MAYNKTEKSDSPMRKKAESAAEESLRFLWKR